MRCDPKPRPVRSGGLPSVAAFALFWLVSDVAEINEGRHLAFVGMVLGILLACLGWRIFKILSFPFLYLWLLVPTGTVFLPLLQKIATLLSSSMLQMVGIPVYTEGFFIELPSGRYHIEAGLCRAQFHSRKLGPRTTLCLFALSFTRGSGCLRWWLPSSLRSS